MTCHKGKRVGDHISRAHAFEPAAPAPGQASHNAAPRSGGARGWTASLGRGTRLRGLPSYTDNQLRPTA